MAPVYGACITKSNCASKFYLDMLRRLINCRIIISTVVVVIIIIIQARPAKTTKSTMMSKTTMMTSEKSVHLKAFSVLFSLTSAWLFLSVSLLQLLFYQELIPYRYSSCCSCWDVFFKKPKAASFQIGSG